jgi:hypothetical protein
MSRSTQTLPDGYDQVYAIDLATHKTMAIVLNLAAFAVLIITFWLLAIYVNRVRPELFGTSLSGVFNLAELLLLILLVAANMVVHEMIHGVFFWLFTHSRPVFGLSLSYAYAAAPDWYIPMSRYWIIGLAPLLVIGMAGLAVMAFCPPAWLLPTAVVIGFNTGGAAGDMWIVYQLFRNSPACMVRDTGHSVHFYEPKKPGE